MAMLPFSVCMMLIPKGCRKKYMLDCSSRIAIVALS